ncbi:hypothetical protein ABTF39_20820, partial [Acinetobacter baumannii]
MAEFPGEEWPTAYGKARRIRQSGFACYGWRDASNPAKRWRMTTSPASLTASEIACLERIDQAAMLAQL